MRHGSDGPTTPDSPLRPSRRGPRGLSLTPRRFSHRPVFARLRLPTRRRARATWLVAYSAVTLPSTGPRESSSYDPKTSEGGNVLCTLPRSSRVFVFLPEDERRRESPVFTPDVGFNILAALSSRTFGERTKGGVPNNVVLQIITYWYDL